jgi:cytochrome c oxidase cbb3-type subunit III
MQHDRIIKGCDMPRVTRFIGPALLFALVWWITGVTFAAYAQTPAPDPKELGARLFAENCVVCHGPQGQGRVGATLNKDWPSIRPELTVKSIITNGVAGSKMPAWSNANGGPLSEAEIDALTLYILSWQTGGAPSMVERPTATSIPPITPIPEVKGDPNLGASLFSENCAVCHGAQAQGRQGATLAKNWPGVRPDLGIRTTIANGVSGSVMPAWSTAQGGPLNDGEIDNLVAYILAVSAKAPVVQIAPTSASGNPMAGASQSPLAGWIGVVIAIVIFIVVLVAAIYLQRQR